MVAKPPRYVRNGAYWNDYDICSRSLIHTQFSVIFSFIKNDYRIITFHSFASMRPSSIMCSDCLFVCFLRSCTWQMNDISKWLLSHSARCQSLYVFLLHCPNVHLHNFHSQSVIVYHFICCFVVNSFHAHINNGFWWKFCVVVCFRYISNHVIYYHSNCFVIFSVDIYYIFRI